MSRWSVCLNHIGILPIVNGNTTKLVHARGPMLNCSYIVYLIMDERQHIYIYIYLYIYKEKERVGKILYISTRVSLCLKFNLKGLFWFDIYDFTPLIVVNYIVCDFVFNPVYGHIVVYAPWNRGNSWIMSQIVVVLVNICRIPMLLNLFV